MTPEDIRGIEESIYTKYETYIKNMGVKVVKFAPFTTKSESRMMRVKYVEGEDINPHEIHKDIMNQYRQSGIGVLKENGKIVVNSFQLTSKIYDPNDFDNTFRGLMVRYHYEYDEPKKVNSILKTLDRY